MHRVSRTSKIFIPVFMTVVVFILAILFAFATGDLSNCDQHLSTGEVVLKRYHPREIVIMADYHRIVDTPGYRIEQDGKWQTM